MAAAKKIQKHLDQIQPWLPDWKITVNAQKISAILFSYKSDLFTSKIHTHKLEEKHQIHWSKHW